MIVDLILKRPTAASRATGEKPENHRAQGVQRHEPERNELSQPLIFQDSHFTVVAQ
jgi:hypothetical protein